MRNDEHVECWNVYGFTSAVCLIIMHLCMFYFKAFQFVSFFSYVKLHGASFPDVWCLVASSSPVGGSRTLQIGIRSHVAVWASMGHENQ